ncbi:MAG: tRNA epoxyqueuosine(34) reductase QueG [Phototrophicaceae bacterium]
MTISADDIRTYAQELGFNLVGFIPATPSTHLSHYLAWIEANQYGEMGYLARPDRVARRRDLSLILPNVRSMILVGMDYRPYVEDLSLLDDPARGRIASYAWHLDYHPVLLTRLQTLANKLGMSSPSHKCYVDTGALLERSHAWQAGLGFIGKNTMLIHPKRGSYFFLGEILTTHELDEYSPPLPESQCGRCTRCLKACPTDAFPKPYVMDAGKCISYHTIENKGWVEPSLRSKFRNWIYGCDVCQDVCPWQRFAPHTVLEAFQPTNFTTVAPWIVDVLRLDDTTFDELYHSSPIHRIKRERLVRNACIAAGNWGSEETVAPLKRLLNDPSRYIRGHAMWALGQILKDQAITLIEKELIYEKDEELIREYNNTRTMLQPYC